MLRVSTSGPFSCEYKEDHKIVLRRNIWRHLWSSQQNAHGLSICKIKPAENSVLHWIRTHYLRDTSTARYPSDLGNWELATLWVRNIPLNGEEYNWIYERSYIWTPKKDEDMIDHRTYIRRTSEVVKLKPEKLKIYHLVFGRNYI